MAPIAAGIDPKHGCHTRSPMKRLLPNLCLSIIGLLLVGYVLAGRGFAHIGVPPVYVGEAVLGVSLLLFLAAPDFRIFFESRLVWLIVLFCGWCLAQTIPYYEDFGLDAMRDAVLYGYAIFAFIIASYMMDRKAVANLTVAFGRSMALSVVVLPVILILLMPGVADVPDGEVPLVFIKPGDLAVHLAGALAFRLLRLREATANDPVRWPLDWLFWPSWVALFLWAVSLSRAALLALGCGLMVVALFGYGRRIVVGFFAVSVVAVSVLSAFDIRIETERREISSAQILTNATSIVWSSASGSESVDAGDLESTAMWRLEWWGDIIDYVVFGDYFWTGKGFGVNLADSDGYQVERNGELRSPHNGHLTILARAGVPGLVLWLLIQISFATAMARMAKIMKRNGALVWHRLNLWILAYWTAAVVNASFDVYLEGPQGGIWYWSIMGFGMAVLAVEGRMAAAFAKTAEAPGAAADPIAQWGRTHLGPRVR